MPELPEVETIRNNLRQGTADHPSLIDMTISGAAVYWERTLAVPTLAEFYSKIPGQPITDIHRRGKYLIFVLSNDNLMIHLRMSGELLVEKQSEKIATHHRLIIFLGKEWRLAFNDARKFGRVWLVEDIDEVVGNLGPEPFDEGLGADGFFSMLQKRSRHIKPLLLDQTFIAGIGNIYSDEALFRAGLHPKTKANKITLDQAEALLHTLRDVLSAGIEHNGSSIDWVYKGGDFQNYFQVYKKEGQPCKRCGATIIKIIVGQRGTRICPDCQPIDN